MKFDILNKMIITSSESKVKLRRPVKGLITSLIPKAKKVKEIKKARYAIGNVSKKDLYKIISEFYKLSYESYDNKRSKMILPTATFTYQDSL